MEKVLWEFFCEQCGIVVDEKVCPATDEDDAFTILEGCNVRCKQCGKLAKLRRVSPWRTER